MTYDDAALTRVLGVIVPPVTALVLGISRSLHVPLWRDEYATAMHAELSPPDLARSISGGDAVQAPYYLLIHLLSPVIGLDTGMRVPSLLAFAATAAIVSALGMRWWGAAPGAAAGLFFSLDGAAVTAGATARPYALMVMFVALAIFAADSADRRSRWKWAVYSAAAVLAVAMHLMSIVALLCIGLLALARRRASLMRWITWTVPALAVGIALALIGGSQQDQIAWLPSPDVRSGVSALAQVAGVSVYRAVVWDALGLIVLVAAAAATSVTIGRAAGAKAPRLRPVLFASALVFAAPAALFVLSWIATPVYTARYLSWVSLGAALIVSGAVFAATARDRIPSAIAGICAGVLLAGAALVALQQFAAPPGLYDDMPSLVGELDEDVQVGDILAVIQRNPHSAVAYAVAQTTEDHAWAADVVDRLPQSAQPTVELRSITGTGPLELEGLSLARPAEREATVWIISLDSPSQVDIAQIGEALMCTVHASGADPTFFGGIRLYHVGCGRDRLKTSP
ncbi:MAG TPA: hypothetical protein DCR63_05985 [Microbacterium sp.]|nr:hypothetical protein [Microbacterium sp.]